MVTDSSSFSLRKRLFLGASTNHPAWHSMAQPFQSLSALRQAQAIAATYFVFPKKHIPILRTMQLQIGRVATLEMEHDGSWWIMMETTRPHRTYFYQWQNQLCESSLQSSGVSSPPPWAKLSCGLVPKLSRIWRVNRSHTILDQSDIHIRVVLRLSVFPCSTHWYFKSSHLAVAVQAVQLATEIRCLLSWMMDPAARIVLAFFGSCVKAFPK